MAWIVRMQVFCIVVPILGSAFYLLRQRPRRKVCNKMKPHKETQKTKQRTIWFYHRQRLIILLLAPKKKNTKRKRSRRWRDE